MDKKRDGPQEVTMLFLRFKSGGSLSGSLHVPRPRVRVLHIKIHCFTARIFYRTHMTSMSSPYAKSLLVRACPNALYYSQWIIRDRARFSMFYQTKRFSKIFFYFFLWFRFAPPPPPHPDPDRPHKKTPRPTMAAGWHKIFFFFQHPEK